MNMDQEKRKGKVTKCFVELIQKINYSKKNIKLDVELMKISVFVEVEKVIKPADNSIGRLAVEEANLLSVLKQSGIILKNGSVTRKVIREELLPLKNGKRKVLMEIIVSLPLDDTHLASLFGSMVSLA